jgi:hypothetical protein
VGYLFLVRPRRTLRMRRKRLTIFASAAAATITGLAFFVLHDRWIPPDHSVAQAMQAAFRPTVVSLGDQDRDTELREFRLASHVTCPTQARLSDSVVIELQAELISTAIITRDHVRLPEAQPPQARRPDICGRHWGLVFRLDLPGMDYTPEQRLSEGCRATWVVRAKTAGHFAGSVTPSEPVHGNPFEPFSWSEPVRFDITVTDSFVTPREIRSGFIYVMGSLLTIPGIWTFSRALARYRAERNKKTASIITSSHDA